MEIKMSSIREEKPKDIKTISERNKNDRDNNLTNTFLEQLGYDEWFDDKRKEFPKDDFSIARIVEVNRNNYKVSNGQDAIFAELSGKFLFDAANTLDFPTVGDWVVVQYFDDYSLAIIHHILPRKSLLKRKDPGKAVEFQLIAANIDYALIMQSVDSNFNLNRLERYFVMINESKIQPIVVLSKTDLISTDELSEINDQIRKFNSKYLVLPISNVSNQGITTLQNALESGKTYCLLGSSGVGKTTLLNKLLGEELFKVNEVREKDSKGRHTSTRRQLIRLEAGSIFIDTPGMRELGNFAVDTGLEETFHEIASYSSQCRFNNCTHTHEEGCAVIGAVEQGIIDEERYKNFLRIQKESAYYEMSYLDKRKRDKAFGKMVKNYKKRIRKK
jgi:ribosome biogenesis GTPase